MINDKSTEEFLYALSEAEIVLDKMSFAKYDIIQKGYAYFVYYKKNDIHVEFLFGPPEFQIEMILYISNNKIAFKDLLNIPEILYWVDNNKYKHEDARNIKNEIFWFIELLKISLSILE